MSTLAVPGPRGFPRRTMLAASAVGLAVLAVGCTSGSPEERERVTGEQADQLLAQVGVQETLVAAFTAAGAADPALAGEVADLAAQVEEQRDRLRAAAPGASPSPTSPGTPPSPAEARSWLRSQVAAAADSHAAACVDQSGARAALLGAITAGLRGQDGRLA
jgi:phage I-like protein